MLHRMAEGVSHISYRDMVRAGGLEVAVCADHEDAVWALADVGSSAMSLSVGAGGAELRQEDGGMCGDASMVSCGVFTLSDLADQSLHALKDGATLSVVAQALDAAGHSVSAASGDIVITGHGPTPTGMTIAGPVTAINDATAAWSHATAPALAVSMDSVTLALGDWHGGAPVCSVEVFASPVQSNGTTSGYDTSIAALQCPECNCNSADLAGAAEGDGASLLMAFTQVDASGVELVLPHTLLQVNVTWLHAHEAHGWELKAAVTDASGLTTTVQADALLVVDDEAPLAANFGDGVGMYAGEKLVMHEVVEKAVSAAGIIEPIPEVLAISDPVSLRRDGDVDCQPRRGSALAPYVPLVGITLDDFLRHGIAIADSEPVPVEAKLVTQPSSGNETDNSTLTAVEDYSTLDTLNSTSMANDTSLAANLTSVLNETAAASPPNATAAVVTPALPTERLIAAQHRCQVLRRMVRYTVAVLDGTLPGRDDDVASTLVFRSDDRLAADLIAARCPYLVLPSEYTAAVRESVAWDAGSNPDAMRARAPRVTSTLPLWLDDDAVIAAMDLRMPRRHADMEEDAAVVLPTVYSSVISASWLGLQQPVVGVGGVWWRPATLDGTPLTSWHNINSHSLDALTEGALQHIVWEALPTGTVVVNELLMLNAGACAAVRDGSGVDLHHQMPPLEADACALPEGADELRASALDIAGATIQRSDGVRLLCVEGDAACTSGDGGLFVCV
jgi:hypothetical protein